MVLFAFSLQDQVEKYGAYVAVACFFGLAVLSLLYFAQARELRRLREWAGRSPEFEWEEIERRVLSLESRRAAAPARVAPPVPAVATNGATKLKPEQVAALAFARAAGVAEPPHPPKPAAAPVPQPVAVAAEAPAAEAPAVVPPPPAPAPETAVETVPVTGNGNGHGPSADVPAPSTPAGRRPPAAPLRAAQPPRRPTPPAPARRMPSGPPARRETSTRSVVLMSVLGLILAGAVAFGAVKLLGGGDAKTPTKPNVVVPAGSDEQSSGGSASGTKPKASTPPRADTTVAVLNGTPSAGLAADTKDRLIDAGYTRANVGADNDPNGKGVATSVVYYKPGAAAQAKDVARVLDIARSQVKPVGAETPTVSSNPSVIVEIGADKTGN